MNLYLSVECWRKLGINLDNDMRNLSEKTILAGLMGIVLLFVVIFEVYVNNEQLLIVVSRYLLIFIAFLIFTYVSKSFKKSTLSITSVRILRKMGVFLAYTFSLTLLLFFFSPFITEFIRWAFDIRLSDNPTFQHYMDVALFANFGFIALGFILYSIGDYFGNKVKKTYHMETDYSKIKVHPIFSPIKRIFEFAILGIGFVGQPDFQKAFLEMHPELASMVRTYNNEVNLKHEGGSIKANAGLYWNHLGRMMAISIFDILMFSKYHNYLKNEEIFKFTKLLRHGAAHDNVFDLNDLKSPIEWGEYKVEKTLQGTAVFPDFISAQSLIHLMADISAVIDAKEKK